MKKLALIMSVVVLLFAFAGCGGNNTSQSNASSASTAGTQPAESTADTQTKQPVELVCMVQSSPECEFIKTVASSYMQAAGNENVKITINELGRDNFDARLQNQLFTQSDGVDFFFTSQLGFGALIAGGVVENLDPYFEKPEIKEKGFTKELFTKGGIDASTLNGSLYGIPFTTSTKLLFYRKDLIPTPPQTWEEYRDIAKKFTRSLNPDSPTEYGATITAKPNSGSLNVSDISPIAWSMGGDYVDTNNNAVVNSESNIKALEYWKSLLDLKVVPPDSATYEYTNLVTAFQQEKVAMEIQFNSAGGTYADAKQSPKIFDKYAVAPVPGTKQADGSILRKPYLSGWTTGINQFSKHKDEAFEFLTYFYNAENYKTHLTPQLSISTAMNDVLKSDEFKKLNEASHMYDAFAASLEQGRSYNPNKQLSTILSILDTDLHSALVGQMTPKDALDAAQKEIEAKIKE